MACGAAANDASFYGMVGDVGHTMMQIEVAGADTPSSPLNR
jgi:hypothetical protein